MMDANAFLRRMLLVAAVSALSMGAYAHGGGGGKGTGGSSGGGSASSGSSSSGGHSASSTSGGHAATASAHSAASASKSSHNPHDPPNVSQSAMGNPAFHVRVFRIFQQAPSTGYTTQYREMNNEDWRRKHQRLFLGFIRY